MKTLILIACVAFFSISCTEEIGPCYANEQYCKELLRKMNATDDPKEKEQIRQFYLSELKFLEGCYRQNGK